MKTHQNAVSKFVSAEQLLEAIFEPESRPSLRWLREQTARRRIPFVKIGKLVFFDPQAVKEALAKRTVEAAQ